MFHLPALKRDAVPARRAGLFPAAQKVFVQIVALLAHERKWRRDRAALAPMDYTALRDIGFAPAPWDTDAGASDRFARSIVWTSAKQLRARLADCSRARDAAQAAIRQNRADQ